MPSPWTYDDKLHRYRDTSSGRIVGKKQLLELRDDFVESQRGAMDTLTTKLTNGDITIQRWQSDSRDLLKNLYLDEYAAGRGGRHNLTQEDYGSIGGMLQNQYRYHNDFAALDSLVRPRLE